jgi:hypothetical protein
MMYSTTRFANIKNKFSEARVVRERFESMAWVMTMFKSQVARNAKIVILAVQATDKGRIVKY